MKLDEIVMDLAKAPLRFHLCAEGDNAKSNLLKLKMTWDGKVAVKDERMQQHLKLETDE